MAVIVDLPADLRSWIAGNLARGAPPAAVVEALVGRNFERSVACGVVDAFVSAHAAGRAPPEGVRLDAPAHFVYETPRIAPGHLISACDREIRVLQRLQKPVVVVLESVLTDDECERLIGMAQPRLRNHC